VKQDHNSIAQNLFFLYGYFENNLCKKIGKIMKLFYFVWFISLPLLAGKFDAPSLPLKGVPLRHPLDDLHSRDKYPLYQQPSYPKRGGLEYSSSAPAFLNLLSPKVRPWNTRKDVWDWLKSIESFINHKDFNHISLSRALLTIVYQMKVAPQSLSFSLLSILEEEKNFLEAWENKAMGLLNTFNAQALSNTMYAWAQLGLTPSTSILDAWEKSFLEKAKSFNAQNLSNTLYAWAQLGLSPSLEVLRAWEQSFLAKARSFNAQDVSNTIYAWAQ
jgi:hypothetical protein